MTFNRNLSDLIDSRTERKEKALYLGKVTAVYDKTSDDYEEGNIEVNVQSRTVDHEFREIPVICSDHSGHTYVPQKGDYAVVEWMMGRGRQPVVIGMTPTDQDRSPNARAGHWRHEFRHENIADNLYLEAEPRDRSAGDPETVRMAIKEGGLAEPSTELGIDHSPALDGEKPIVRALTDGHIEFETTDEGHFDLTVNREDITVRIDQEGDVDVSTEDGDVTVQSESGDVTLITDDGDINVEAQGAVSVEAEDVLSLEGDSVVINTDEGPKTVAYNDHTHQYSDTGDTDSGGAGATTKTTSEPLEEGTETVIG